MDSLCGTQYSNGGCAIGILCVGCPVIYGSVKYIGFSLPFPSGKAVMKACLKLEFPFVHGDLKKKH